jgi:hypothetical protein
MVDSKGHRPLPAVRDFTRDGRWSTYDVSVLKKMGGRCAQTEHPVRLPSPTKLARLGHFPPASQAGRLAGLVFYVYVFSLVDSAPLTQKLRQSREAERSLAFYKRYRRITITELPVREGLSYKADSKVTE